MLTIDLNFLGHPSWSWDKIFQWFFRQRIQRTQRTQWNAVEIETNQGANEQIDGAGGSGNQKVGKCTIILGNWIAGCSVFKLMEISSNGGFPDFLRSSPSIFNRPCYFNLPSLLDWQKKVSQVDGLVLVSLCFCYKECFYNPSYLLNLAIYRGPMNHHESPLL